MYRLVGKADAEDAYVHTKADALHFFWENQTVIE